jgi:hypothetical protein
MTYETPKYAEGVTYYLPAEWMDESLPDLAGSPLDFVEQDGTGQWWLRLPAGNPERDDPHYNTKIEPDHAYSFNERRMYGSFWLTIREDGTWTCEGVPAECNCFSNDIWSEDIWESIDELVERGNLDSLGKPMLAGTYEIEAWHWSDDFSLLFEVNAETNQPTLTQIGHA